MDISFISALRYLQVESGGDDELELLQQTLMAIGSSSPQRGVVHGIERLFAAHLSARSSLQSSSTVDDAVYFEDLDAHDRRVSAHSTTDVSVARAGGVTATAPTHVAADLTPDEVDVPLRVTAYITPCGTPLAEVVSVDDGTRLHYDVAPDTLDRDNNSNFHTSSLLAPTASAMVAPAVHSVINMDSTATCRENLLVNAIGCTTESLHIGDDSWNCAPRLVADAVAPRVVGTDALYMEMSSSPAHEPLAVNEEIAGRQLQLQRRDQRGRPRVTALSLLQEREEKSPMNPPAIELEAARDAPATNERRLPSLPAHGSQIRPEDALDGIPPGFDDDFVVPLAVSPFVASPLLNDEHSRTSGDNVHRNDPAAAVHTVAAPTLCGSSDFSTGRGRRVTVSSAATARAHAIFADVEQTQLQGTVTMCTPGGNVQRDVSPVAVCSEIALQVTLNAFARQSPLESSAPVTEERDRVYRDSLHRHDEPTAAQRIAATSMSESSGSFSTGRGGRVAVSSAAAARARAIFADAKQTQQQRGTATIRTPGGNVRRVFSQAAVPVALTVPANRTMPTLLNANSTQAPQMHNALTTVEETSTVTATRALPVPRNLLPASEPCVGGAAIAVSQACSSGGGFSTGNGRLVVPSATALARAAALFAAPRDAALIGRDSSSGLKLHTIAALPANASAMSVQDPSAVRCNANSGSITEGIVPPGDSNVGNASTAFQNSIANVDDPHIKRSADSGGGFFNTGSGRSVSVSAAAIARARLLFADSGGENPAPLQPSPIDISIAKYGIGDGSELGAPSDVITTSRSNAATIAAAIPGGNDMCIEADGAHVSTTEYNASVVSPAQEQHESVKQQSPLLGAPLPSNDSGRNMSSPELRNGTLSRGLKRSSNGSAVFPAQGGSNAVKFMQPDQYGSATRTGSVRGRCGFAPLASRPRTAVAAVSPSTVMHVRGPAAPVFDVLSTSRAACVAPGIVTPRMTLREALVFGYRPGNLPLEAVTISTTLEEEGDANGETFSLVVVSRITCDNAIHVKWNALGLPILPQGRNPGVANKSTIAASTAHWGIGDVRAILLAKGCSASVASRTWVANHYRWVVSKLAVNDVRTHRAATEWARAGRLYVDATSSGKRWCVLSRVVSQLLYRYERERRNERSTLRRIFEGDSPPEQHMVLAVASSSTATLTPEMTVELTDGWYGVRALLSDDHLVALLRTGRIRVGAKIRVCNAELLQHSGAISATTDDHGGDRVARRGFAAADGCSALDVDVNARWAMIADWRCVAADRVGHTDHEIDGDGTGSPTQPVRRLLSLNFNSVRPAPWDTRLGFARAPLFACTLAGLRPGGGDAPCIQVGARARWSNLCYVILLANVIHLRSVILIRDCTSIRRL